MFHLQFNVFCKDTNFVHSTQTEYFVLDSKFFNVMHHHCDDNNVTLFVLIKKKNQLTTESSLVTVDIRPMYPNSNTV